jgi:hypothetical protein
MPVSGPPSWTALPLRSYQTKSPMQPLSGVCAVHGTVVPTALAEQTFRISVVPGGRLPKLLIRTWNVTV